MDTKPQTPPQTEHGLLKYRKVKPIKSNHPVSVGLSRSRQEPLRLPHMGEVRRGRAEEVVEEGELRVGGDAREGGQVDEEGLKHKHGR